MTFGATVVKVKPLEWKERVGVAGLFDAYTSIGHYIATITDDDRGMWLVVGLTQSNYCAPDIDAVKAAAQADFERRILSALEPAVSEREPVAWRWKPKDSEAWIYDPKHEWLEAQSRDEIDAEPLYAAPPTSELEALRKRVAELEGEGEREWQPIETAPKPDVGADGFGKRLLLAVNRGEGSTPSVRRGYWEGTDWYLDCCMDVATAIGYDVTHWRPVPEPPAIEMP